MVNEDLVDALTRFQEHSPHVKPSTPEQSVGSVLRLFEEIGPEGSGMLHRALPL